MAGIFSRGFGFPSTSLAAAAEATAKGSAGSSAGAGLRPARRPPLAEGKGKSPGRGPRSNPASAPRGAGCGGGPVAVLGGSHLDGRCSRIPRPSWAAGSSGQLPLAILLLGTRGLEAHINLSLHLRSKEAPLEEKRRGRTSPAPGSCGVNRRGKDRAAAGGKQQTAEEREGGRAHGAQDVSTKRQLPP